MTYELAKQLKEAGFSQTPTNEPCPVWLGSDGRIINGSEPYPSTIETAYAPTLSELIEACGEDFAELRFDKNRPDGIWRAYANVGGVFNKGRERPRGLGSTPEEAVAALWLALNAHTK